MTSSCWLTLKLWTCTSCSDFLDVSRLWLLKTWRRGCCLRVIKETCIHSRVFVWKKWASGSSRTLLQISLDSRGVDDAGSARCCCYFFICLKGCELISRLCSPLRSYRCFHKDGRSGVFYCCCFQPIGLSAETNRSLPNDSPSVWKSNPDTHSCSESLRGLEELLLRAHFPRFLCGNEVIWLIRSAIKRLSVFPFRGLHKKSN